MPKMTPMSSQARVCGWAGPLPAILITARVRKTADRAPRMYFVSIGPYGDLRRYLRTARWTRPSRLVPERSVHETVLQRLFMRAALFAA